MLSRLIDMWKRSPVYHLDRHRTPVPRPFTVCDRPLTRAERAVPPFWAAVRWPGLAVQVAPGRDVLRWGLGPGGIRECLSMSFLPVSGRGPGLGCGCWPHALQTRRPEPFRPPSAVSEGLRYCSPARVARQLPAHESTRMKSSGRIAYAADRSSHQRPSGDRAWRAMRAVTWTQVAGRGRGWPAPGRWPAWLPQRQPGQARRGDPFAANAQRTGSKPCGDSAEPRRVRGRITL